MKVRNIFFLPVSFAVIVIAAIDIHPATLTVTKIEDTNDGVCNADCSLREAIAVAASGDTVVFSRLFISPRTITLQNGEIDLSTSITIIGPGRDLLSISGNNLTRIFRITGGAVVDISRLTLRDARVTSMDAAGGAIRLISSSLTLSDVKVINNFVRYENPPFVIGYGGGVFCENGSLNVHNSVISGNTALEGAGIATSQGIVNITGTTFTGNIGTAVLSVDADSINITDSTFIQNRAGISFGSNGHGSLSDSVITQNGAGVGIDYDTVATIDRTVITDSNATGVFADVGAGLFNRGVTTVRNSSISHNYASSRGGGIWNTRTLYIIDSAITGNTAQDSGGGVFNAIGTTFITNSTVSGNSATRTSSVGGGVYNFVDGSNTGARIFLANSTVAFNHAGLKGGGIRNDLDGSVSTANTIIAQNFAGFENDLSGIAASAGYNLVGSTLGNSGWTSSDLLNRDPQLVALADNGGNTLTHALLLGSPAKNAGSNDLAVDPQTMLPLKTDQRGFERYFGATVDIGAFESDVPLQSVTIGGRVRTASSRGVPNTRISLDDGFGGLTYAQTNSSGFYHLHNVIAGRTYLISATNKVFVLDSPRIVMIDNAREDIDFTAGLPPDERKGSTP
jgi:CSLREA domain-containing protein